MTRALVLAGLMLAQTSTAATHAAREPCDATQQETSQVMLGHVVERQTQWLDERLLVTTYTVRIGEVIAGSPRSTATVRLPGGNWQGWTQQAAGVPLLGLGDQVLLVSDDIERIPLRGVHRVEEGQIVPSVLLHDDSFPTSIHDLRVRFSGT